MWSEWKWRERTSLISFSEIALQDHKGGWGTVSRARHLRTRWSTDPLTSRNSRGRS